MGDFLECFAPLLELLFELSFEGVVSLFQFDKVSFKGGDSLFQVADGRGSTRRIYREIWLPTEEMHPPAA